MQQHTDDPPARQTARLIKPLAVIMVALSFFLFTSPRQVPSVMLIAGFILLAALLYSCLKLLLIFSGLYAKISASASRALLLCGTLLPLLLVVLQSIGQLTVRDMLVLGTLLLIAAFYSNRVMLDRRNR